MGLPAKLAFACGAVVLGAVLLSSTYRPIFLSGAGLAQGALIAAIALGVVLTYRGSGVVNIANGAIAVYAAYVYTTLRNDGDLFLPPLPNPFAAVEWLVHVFQPNDTFDLPDIPVAISFGPTMQFWPAFALSLLFCVQLGLVLHFLVFRPLRNAPALARVVASIGVYLTLVAIIVRRFSASSQSVKPLPFVDKQPVDLWLTSPTQEQLFVGLLVVASAVGLSFISRRTRFGLATRAAAENEKGSMVLGYSPDLLAGANWVLATVLTGALGIFVASVNSNVDPTVIPALIVPALTAALVGGFTSFGWTTVAAFLLGMQLPLVQALGAREDWFPRADTLPIPGVETLVPLVVIVAVLYFRGNPLPVRGAITADHLPDAPEPGRLSMAVLGPIVAVGTAVAAMFWLTPSYRIALSNTLIGVIICLSIVVITGYVGKISLAPLTFAGISAFAVAELSVDRGWPFPLPILAGAIVAALVGVIIAVPALRVRGVNLAIVTLAFALTADRFIFDNSDVNGGLERALVDTPEWMQQNRATSYTVLGTFTAGDGKQPNPMTALFILLVVVVLAYLVANLRRSATGRRMLAVRNNERAAASAGVDVARTKTVAFGLSALIAGIGGAMIAYRAGEASPARFAYAQSLAFFAFAYLGGITRVSGAVVGGVLASGGILVTFGGEALGIPDEFTLLLAGFGLIVGAIMSPQGIAGRVRRRAEPEAETEPESEPTPEPDVEPAPANAGEPARSLA
ncbi:MAG: ABC transporter permease [Actinomycetota bacterium]